jgi:Ca2+-binding EF-hand superfamily protein
MEDEAKLRRIFKHYDNDNSGYLDTQELKGILEKVGEREGEGEGGGGVRLCCL